MKLIIQIPCLNEQDILPVVLAELPQKIDGVDVIEVLVIDDGSTDQTVQVAREHGVTHIVSHPANLGLAETFKTGIHYCLQNGADIIVNLDADNQYPPHYIPSLITPILRNRVHIVIGNRQVAQIQHFSPMKKLLQYLGSAVVRTISSTNVPDAPSGFRAFSREAAMRLSIFTEYTYTLETIIQAGKKNLIVEHIPIEVNPQTRESRLVKTNFNYVLRSVGTILKLFLLYEPLLSFSYLALVMFIIGGGLWARYLVLLLLGQVARGSNIQSITVGSVALITSALIFFIGLLGQILATNRQLNEEILFELKKQRFDTGHRQGVDETPKPG